MRSYHSVCCIGEGIVALFAAPNPFLLNKICLNQYGKIEDFITRETFAARYSLLLAPLTMSAQRSWWYIVRRPSSRCPSVNFCFKSLLLLQFLFDNSEFFTGETRHIVPPCNKAGISNFCLEFQKLQKFQISWKRYSSYSSYSIILNFLLEKLGI